MAGDRKGHHTVRVSLFDSVWAWFSVILCEFSADKTEEKMLVYLNPGMRSSSSHHSIGRNIFLQMKKGTKCI